ncbi:hypothetical protein pb186bvf_013431 [Paramecium bursaria]
MRQDFQFFQYGFEIFSFQPPKLYISFLIQSQEVCAYLIMILQKKQNRQMLTESHVSKATLNAQSVISKIATLNGQSKTIAAMMDEETVSAAWNAFGIQ